MQKFENEQEALTSDSYEVNAPFLSLFHPALQNSPEERRQSEEAWVGLYFMMFGFVRIVSDHYGDLCLKKQNLS